MLPAITYEEVCARLKDKFESGDYPDGPVGFHRMTGLLFAPAGAKLAKDEIIPNLNRFHNHSGPNIDFFCVGYGIGLPPKHWDTDYKELPEVEGKTWSYSDSAFKDFRKHIHEISTWRYSEGSDLLLANARYSFLKKSAEIEFEGAVDLKLDEMLAIGAIISVETFFGKIFQFAEDSSGKDPTWGFSDKEGMGCLKRFVLSLLPKNMGKEVQKAAFYAVRDLRKAA